MPVWQQKEIQKVPWERESSDFTQAGGIVYLSKSGRYQLTRLGPACEMGNGGVFSSRMPQRLEADREVVKQLWIQGLKISKISELTGVKPKTIRTWSRRYGWSKIASDASVALEQTGEKALSVQVAQSMIERSRAVRSNLASVVEGQAELLVQNPPAKVSQLANTRTGQGFASITKTVTETAAAIFGWKEKEEKPGMIQIEASLIVTRRNELPTVEAEVVSAGESGS